MKISTLRNRVLALAVLLAGSFSTNVLAQPFCGDVILANTTLSNDLLGCPSVGLLVISSNVTLDCNGHTIESLGHRVVEVNPNLSNVAVENCVLVSSANTDAVRVHGGTTNITIIGNTITTSAASGNGIRTLGTANSNFSDNTIITAGLNANGIRLQGSPDNVLENNNISTSGQSSRGFRLQTGSNNNLIMGNTVHTSGASAPAVLLRAGGDGNFLQDNVLRADNAQPIRFESSSGNVFDDNSLQSSSGWLLSRRFAIQNGGMSVHPLSGRLFAVENSFGGGFGVGTATAFIEIDPATGDVIDVKRLTQFGVDLGFGFDALEITLDDRFIALRGSGFGELYEIDPVTAEVTFLFFVGSLNGLESNGIGSLLATSNQGSLMSIDLGTGITAFIGFAGPGWTDLAADPISGKWYALSRHSTEPSETNHLWVIDPATGAKLEEIGDIGLPFVSDMDFAPDGTLFGNDASVLVIDPETATAQSLGNFGEDPFEPPSLANTLVKTTMVAADGSGSIHYPGPLAVPNAEFTDVSIAELDISFNRVFVDSVVFPFLNQPATNTLLGLTGERRILVVDDDDDGTFDDCPATQCTLVNFAGGTLVFDVTGFTTYSSEACASNSGKGPGGNGPPGPDGNGPPGLCKAKGPDGNGPPGLTGDHPKGGPPGKNK